MNVHPGEIGEGAAMPQLVLRLLGPFQATLGERPITGFESNKVRALLAYLAVEADRPHSRDELIGLLWPDQPDATARANLRQALANLRQVIGDRKTETPFLLVTSESIQFQRLEDCRVDATTYIALSAECQTHPHRHLDTCRSCARRLQAAVELYQGDFLAQFIQSGSEAFEEWTLLKREQLHQAALDALYHLTQHCDWRGEYDQALRYARRQLELDPWREEAHRQAMRALVLTEQRSAALAQYEVCRHVLSDELGAEPSAETTALYGRIKSGTLASDIQRYARPTPQTPLIGREGELAEVNAVWHKARAGEGQVLLISGEPGIGKTRLMHELLAQERYSAAYVLWGECYAEGGAPYAPLAQAVQVALDLLGTGNLNTSTLADLITLIPALRERFPAIPPRLPLEPQAEQQRLFDSVAGFFVTLAARAPVLLLIEDAHWADSATLALLRHLARRARRVKLLIIITQRDVVADQTPAFRDLLSDLQGERLATPLTLARLDLDHTRNLLAALFQEDITPEFLEGLYRATEGNPFFITEVCQALIDEGVVYREGEGWQRRSMAQIQIPHSVRLAIQRRVDRLPEAAQDTLQRAAVLGREFEFDVLQAMSDLSEEALIDALETAERAQLIDEVTRASRTAKLPFTFVHALISATLHESLSSLRRKQLHRQAAAALTKQRATDLDSVTVQIALHYERAGLTDQAAEFYRRGAEAARHVYANQDALERYRHAVRLFDPTSDQLSATYEGLGDVQALIGQHAEAQTAFEMAVQCTSVRMIQSRLYRKQGKNWEARRHTSKALVAYDYAEAALRLSTVQDSAWWTEWIDNRLDQIGALYLLNYQSRLETLGRELRPVIDRQASLAQRGRFYGNLVAIGNRQERFRTSDETLAYAYAALEASRAVGDQSDLAYTLFRVGFCHLWRDEFDQAEKYFMASAETNNSTGSAFNRLVLSTYLTVLYRRRGQIDQVRQSAEQCLALAAEQTNLTYQGMAHANLAWVAWRAAQLPETLQLGQLAQETWRDLGMTNPLLWLAWWPLLGVKVKQDQLAEAVDYARMMLDTSQQLLPDQLTAQLENAIGAWEQFDRVTARRHLENTLPLAQGLGYL